MTTEYYIGRIHHVTGVPTLKQVCWAGQCTYKPYDWVPPADWVLVSAPTPPPPPPTDPCAGVTCPNACYGTSYCTQECVNGKCVKSGVIDALSVRCGYVPPKPECTEGDKKPGHVCSGGKWVPFGMPGPIPHGEPSTIEAPEIIPGIKPPRIPLLTPELAKIPLLPGWVIRDADGRIVAGRAPDTIEFQEIIPGITPPRIPQLIPRLEDLPLLPGWTIRNPAGTIVAHGAHLPTILEEK